MSHEPSCVRFGGCLLRTTTDKGIGNLADAAFPEAINCLAARYPNAAHDSGHGPLPATP